MRYLLPLSLRAAGRSRGFTLTEILIAVAILLIGVVAALKIFPPGFDAYMAGQQVTVAQRLINNTLTAFQEDPNSLPDAILPVWTTDPNQSLPPYNPYYPNYIDGAPPLSFTDLNAVDWRSASSSVGLKWYSYHLYPDIDDPWPLWEPTSVRVLRRIIGEKVSIPSNFSASLRFGPVQANGDPTNISNINNNNIIVYDLRYRKVAKPVLDGMNQNGNGSSNSADQLYYALTSSGNQQNMLDTINLLSNASYQGASAIRLSFFCQNQQNSSDIEQVAPTLVYPMTTTPTALPITTTSNTSLALTVSQQTIVLPAGWTMIPGSEQLNRAYVSVPFVGSSPSPITTGEYQINPQLGIIYFSNSDGGRTVKVDYSVLDWNILHEDAIVDNDGYLTLSLPNPKVANRPNYPREPNSWGLFNPMPAPGNSGSTAVMALIDLYTGDTYTVQYNPANPSARQYLGADSAALSPMPTNITLDFSDANHRRVRIGGLAANATQFATPNWNALAGRNFRVFYRAQHDWTLQIYKPPAQFWYTTLPVTGWDQYTFVTATNNVYLPNIYAGQSVAVDYTTRAVACTVTALSGNIVTVDNIDKLTLNGGAMATISLYNLAGACLPGLNNIAVSVNTSLQQLALPTAVASNVFVGAQIVDMHSPVLRVSGEIHSVPPTNTQASVSKMTSNFNLWRPLVGNNPLAVRGTSVTVRALWTQPRSGSAWVFDAPWPSPNPVAINERWNAQSATMVLPATKE